LHLFNELPLTSFWGRKKKEEEKKKEKNFSPICLALRESATKSETVSSSVLSHTTKRMNFPKIYGIVTLHVFSGYFR
jgi:hypothetical protein